MSEEPGAKRGFQEQNRVVRLTSELNTADRVGKPPKPALLPDPRTQPYPNPI